MRLPDDQLGPLSVHRAFVVHFDAYTDVQRGHLAGRVEHVVSGQAMEFHSLETLLAFIAQLLPTGHRTVDDGET